MEYFEALKARERRLSEMQRAAGAMHQGEFLNAANALQIVMQYGVENTPLEIQEQAARIAPHYIHALRREQLAKLGLSPDRYPAEKRKQLYAQFAKATGITAEWSLTVPFDDLDATEMDAANGLEPRLDPKAPGGGLAELTKEQRRLLLKAGALDYFASQLGLER